MAADYLHCGRSALARYMPETELRCRDDVYRHIRNFLENGCHSFYVEANRLQFINEMLHAGGSDVLSYYLALLEELAHIRHTPASIQSSRSILPNGN